MEELGYKTQDDISDDCRKGQLTYFTKTKNDITTVIIIDWKGMTIQKKYIVDRVAKDVKFGLDEKYALRDLIVEVDGIDIVKRLLVRVIDLNIKIAEYEKVMIQGVGNG